MSSHNPVGWFEIYANDIHRAQTFYESVFQVALSDLPNPLDDGLIMKAFPQGEGSGAGGALVYMKGAPVGQGGTIVYFTSEDCALEETRIKTAGGTIFKPKTSLGEYGFMVLAIDTEGNMFGIHSMK